MGARALSAFYPLSNRGSWHPTLDRPDEGVFHATDFRVRILDPEEATAAKTRVLIESSDGEENWGTVGVSENIVEASWEETLDRASHDDYLVAMSVDADGNICVTGDTDNGVNTDVLAIGYNRDGILVGSTLYNGLADSDDAANAITVNSLEGREIAQFQTEPEPITVPDVAGQTEADANAAITGAGLIPVKVEAPDDAVPAGLTLMAALALRIA